MDKFLIHGGIPLQGKVAVSGAKNAALPEMAASLLTDQVVALTNVPRVRDIATMQKLLGNAGAEVTSDIAVGRLELRAQNISTAEAPYELVKTMRASVLVLGPMLARFGHARVSLPGGCAIGARPIDLHLKALEKLGAKITTEHGYIEARADRLRGAHIDFDRITVTGTENIMMAAALAEGETVLDNAALEPEVKDLADLLNRMGAKIEGAGTSTIHIRGVARLAGAQHKIIPDRIEAGTFLVAGAITAGELEVERARVQHLAAVIAKLEEVGVEIQTQGEECLRVRAPRPLRAADVTTEEYPGFATDMQAQFMALATQAEGTSIITETIFENRFLHASEMCRMGAQITVEGRRAIVQGRTELTGAKVLASDLRASASLLLAGLVAKGETLVDRVYHIDRGYERIETRLRAVGADITRVSG